MRPDRAGTGLRSPKVEAGDACRGEGPLLTTAAKPTRSGAEGAGLSKAGSTTTGKALAEEELQPALHGPPRRQWPLAHPWPLERPGSSSGPEGSGLALHRQRTAAEGQHNGGVRVTPGRTQKGWGESRPCSVRWPGRRQESPVTSGQLLRSTPARDRGQPQATWRTRKAPRQPANRPRKRAGGKQEWRDALCKGRLRHPPASEEGGREAGPGSHIPTLHGDPPQGPGRREPQSPAQPVAEPSRALRTGTGRLGGRARWACCISFLGAPLPPPPAPHTAPFPGTLLANPNRLR